MVSTTRTLALPRRRADAAAPVLRVRALAITARVRAVPAPTTPAVLAAAVRRVRSGEALERVARDTAVAASTLRSRVLGVLEADGERRTTFAAPGRRPALSVKDEAALVDLLRDAADAMVPLTVGGWGRGVGRKGALLQRVRRERPPLGQPRLSEVRGQGEHGDRGAGRGRGGGSDGGGVREGRATSDASAHSQ